MRAIRRVSLVCLLAVFAVGALGACNTTEGFGRDLEHGGEELQEEAREHS